MAFLGYLFFRLLVGIFWLIPFRGIYILSDILYFLVYRVFRYRVGVVSANLKLAFPEKSDLERKQIQDAFYHNLADIMLESIKGMSMSKNQLVKRYNILNPEVYDQFYDSGTPIVGVASHYANWEWGAMSIGYQVKHRVVGYVKPMNNKYIYNYIRVDNARPNVEVCSIYETQESLDRYMDKPTIYMFVTDQTPTNLIKADWIHFLNQDTPCLHGADRIARDRNWPVVHAEINRVKRGYYEVELKLLEKLPNTTSPGDITYQYIKELEAQIKRKPSDWLWSHRRWKRAHEKPEGTLVRK